MDCLNLPYLPARVSKQVVPFANIFFFREELYVYFLNVINISCLFSFVRLSLLLVQKRTVYTESFLYLRNCLVCSFGKIITKERLTQILTLVTTTPVAMQVRRDLFELNSLHKRLLRFFLCSGRTIVAK